MDRGDRCGMVVGDWQGAVVRTGGLGGGCGLSVAKLWFSGGGGGEAAFLAGARF